MGKTARDKHKRVIKVVHIITGLSTGGAEIMLSRVVNGLDKTKFAAQIISLTDIGPVGQKLQAEGQNVSALEMRRGLPRPGDIARLADFLRQARPDVVQTWMYHGDLLGSLAARKAGIRALAWEIQNSSLDPQHSRRSTLWTAKFCARLSRRLPKKIVCCSEASRRIHAELGYDESKMCVIPNGCDLSELRPDPQARREVRQELGIGDETPLIGMMARFDPQKDHHTFMQAAGKLLQRFPDAHFLLCGDRVTPDNAELATWMDAANARANCHLLGRRSDIPRLTAALDVGTLSSAYGEAFSLALGEAMACAVPCVVTDVGDSALIVGETGIAVPPRNPDELAQGWEKLLSLPPEERRNLGQLARLRMEQKYDLALVLRQFEALYEELAQTCAA